MRILAIETSCDETAVALIEGNKNGSGTSIKVVGNALYSQAETHAPFGGVFPMLAKREHAKNIVSLFASCISQANHYDKEHPNTELRPQIVSIITEDKKAKIEKILNREDDLYEDLMLYIESFSLKDSDALGGGFELPHIDAISVTAGPGLEPTLWVGIAFATALGIIFDLPILPINHMEGHIASILAPEGATEDNALEFPALALLISGGHTELVDIDTWGSYKVIGRTKDDAIGEAFDKVARIMGLKYPGGPEISKFAEEYRKTKIDDASQVKDTINSIIYEGINFDITLPRPMLKSMDFDFSFSGLKTAVLYLVKDVKKKLVKAGHIKDETESLPQEIISAICEEFENAVTEVIVYKTSKAIEQTQTKTMILGGGVVANKFIREQFTKLIEGINSQRMEADTIKLRVPPVEYSTDNAIMIGTIACVRSLTDDTYMKVHGVDANRINNETQLSDLIRADGNLSL